MAEKFSEDKLYVAWKPLKKRTQRGRETYVVFCLDMKRSGSMEDISGPLILFFEDRQLSLK